MESSRVVIVRGKGVVTRDGDINRKLLLSMYSRGFQLLQDSSTPTESLQHLFQINDRVGIKINTIGGRNISTRPEVSLPLARLLVERGIPERGIIIWDRTNRELREAGYSLNMNRSALKVMGTDTQGLGYNYDLVSHLNIASRFSRIQTDAITASISLAILKDHGMAGITAGMKNYFGVIHNPNKYHDFNCDPFVAELFETRQIKEKHRLSILDCLVVQFHRGPAYHARWAKNFGALIFSLDPVAADFVGWQIIEELRTQDGLPSLKEENREPAYLKTAAKMGLGKARSEEIKIIEEEL